MGDFTGTVQRVKHGNEVFARKIDKMKMVLDISAPAKACEMANLEMSTIITESPTLLGYTVNNSSQRIGV